MSKQIALDLAHDFPCCYPMSNLQEPGLGAKQKITASQVKTGELLCFTTACEHDGSSVLK